MTKKCFVISPIGMEGSDIRKHADDVFEVIIKPALAKCDFQAIRADHMDEPGKITDQMISAILEYDVCVAVLTGHNPNVFYEIAVAQSAARPIVFLILNGETIPFDVKDFRVIVYDLEPIHVYKGKWIEMVKSQVLKVTSPDYKITSLIDTANMLGSKDSHKYWLNRSSKDFGDAPRYIDVVSKTKSRCDLLGISLKSWGRKASTDSLIKLAGSGCKIRILIFHKDHPSLPHKINPSLPAQEISTVQNEISDMYDHFNEMAKDNLNIEVKQLKEGSISLQLILTDQEALCLQYLYSRTGSDSPLLEFPGGSPLYEAMSDEFETLWTLGI
ncbi:MAG: hypothetical protein GY796_00845 [Chloroflexi bacterium]|nr:hypothetical protein [Chloroflexota bacterium]